MLTLLSPLIGLLGSAIPSLIRFFEKRQDQKHELELTKLQIDAATKQAEIQVSVENVKADVAEGQSLRDHDKSLDGGVFINTLRASIRPVITYVFFFLFVIVKIAAAYVMIKNGQSIPDMLAAVWDTETMSLFSTILAFWFGSRVIEKMDNRIISKPTITATKKK